MTGQKINSLQIAVRPCARCKAVPEVGRDCGGSVTWVYCRICEDEAGTIEDWNTLALRTAFHDIASRLKTLPTAAPPTSGHGWYATHRARQAAADELVGHIRREHAGRISLGGNVERMRLHGISVSCTSGTVNMITAWLHKANAALAMEEQAR